MRFEIPCLGCEIQRVSMYEIYMFKIELKYNRSDLNLTLFLYKVEYLPTLDVCH